MEAYEFEATDINRGMEPPRQSEEYPPPSRSYEDVDEEDEDDFTVNLNPGKLRSGSGAADAQAPLLTTKFIDEQQEARAIEDLTGGLLANLHVPLQQLDEHLLELYRNQQSLITALMAENDKLANLPHWHNIAEVMTKAPTYHQRLHNMRTQMADLSGRMQRLKARSAKLKQRKMGVEEKERQLTAQPAASLLQRRAVGSGSPSPSPSPDTKPNAKGKDKV